MDDRRGGVCQQEPELSVSRPTSHRSRGCDDRRWGGEVAGAIEEEKQITTETRRHRGALGIPSAPPCLRALYVQGNAKMFYYASSCSRDDERSEESCEHDDRPTTDRASACNGRRGAWSKPVSCRFARTAD